MTPRWFRLSLLAVIVVTIVVLFELNRDYINFGMMSDFEKGVLERY